MDFTGGRENFELYNHYDATEPANTGKFTIGCRCPSTRTTSAWLDRENQDKQQLLGLLVPYLAEEMEAYPVAESLLCIEENHF